MWRVVSVLALAGCHFQHGGLSGDAAATDDSGHEIRTWLIDTADDFQHGASQIDVGIDPWGSLTPAGYFYGGLAIAGLDGTALWHAGDPAVSFDAIAGHAPTATARWYGQDITATSPLAYLGVVSPAFSAWLVGEIQLPAGSSQIRLTASDVAFVEIAEPHSDQFTQITVSQTGAAATGAYTAQAAGWHPIRIGWASASPARQLSLAVASGTGTVLALRRDQLRGRAEGPRGLMRYVFNYQALVGTFDATVHPRPQVVPVDAIAAITFPPSPDGAGTGSWSSRWTGQFYATTAGMYTLQADSTDGNGLAFGGDSDANGFSVGTTGAFSTMVPATLNVGWNDVTIDYNSVNGPGSLAVKVTAAPDSALVGGALPEARLRPVEPPGDRISFATDGASHTIPDQGTGTATLRFAGFPSEKVTAVNGHFDYTNPELSGLTITITNPNNDTMTFGPTTTTGNGQHVSTVHIDSGTTGVGQFLTDVSATGTWKVAIHDSIGTSGNKGGTLNEIDLTLHLANGPDPLATSPVWTSAVLDSETVVTSVDAIAWKARDISGLTAAGVKLRACDMPDCSDGTWQVVANGLPPPDGLAGKRYLQAQVSLTSDGVRDPEFEQLSVTYRRNPP